MRTRIKPDFIEGQRIARELPSVNSDSGGAAIEKVGPEQVKSRVWRFLVGLRKSELLSHTPDAPSLTVLTSPSTQHVVATDNYCLLL